MVHFAEISQEQFLSEYWQKKPLVIRNALPGFVNALTPDELAGLSMEEEIESRIVFETPKKAPYWHLKRGPFLAKDFKKLPSSHWTLLVQGVDRFLPEVNAMLDSFNFIPQWRIDDVMISYAAKEGSVGPHYDNYDVFLYQAKGRRKWLLTTKYCNENNYLANVELRIMKEFQIEEEYLLDEGDMLYLPPHVGHYGIARSEDCMTYSFGYRSYQGRELWDSFAEYLAEKGQASYYRDPNWSNIVGASELPQQAWQNAKRLMQQILDDETLFKSWFGCFVTDLDQQAEALLPAIDDEATDFGDFLNELLHCQELIRNPVSRFAYQEEKEEPFISLYINGSQWDVRQVSKELVKLVANSRILSSQELTPYIQTEPNQHFLYQLWSRQWLEFSEP
ncbi:MULTISPECIES: JmjC domain-containing protein [Legionella]|uniref:Cupin n=1 Tax=Legionella drozanskii LLAP-1 TaxID=1212489 RepID=A0A0W0TBT6_9GAMM|nr:MULTISPECIES: cupin domain-containing protein [Legionella]KTC93034.1 cupin [Legionella drozanskii LLAP-1]PJE11939.1 MAG: cupin domain-containing protein [Legionella sp.]